MKKKILEIINLFWTFDNNQGHTHNWHSKQDCLDKINELPNEEERACPCLYLKEPCHDGCSCVNMFSSSGCRNCCTYGSIEQRKAMAERLNEYRLFYNKNKKDDRTQDDQKS